MRTVMALIGLLIITSTASAGFYLKEDSRCDTGAADVALKDLGKRMTCVENGRQSSFYSVNPPLGKIKHYRGFDGECYFEGHAYVRVNWNACGFDFSGKVDSKNPRQPINLRTKNFYNSRAGNL